MVTDNHSSTALGPYTAWMYGPGRAYDFFAADRGDAPHLLSSVLEAPAGHAGPPAPISAGGVTLQPLAPTLWSGLSAPRFMPAVLDGAYARDLDAGTLDAIWRAAGPDIRVNAGFPVRHDSVDSAASSAVTLSADPDIDPSKPLIVVGIIDDGIPFANRAFDGPSGRSRVEACWIQGATHDGSGRVRFGREVTGDDIAALRSAESDEDAIYRAAGAMTQGSPLQGDVAHGAHTLGALADGGDVQVRIIAVDLPPAATWDASGYGRDMLMLAGLHYIFDRADKLAAAHGRDTLPMVVNISYGYSGGSHDGGSMLEVAFDELMEARRALAPTGFTLPAGNMFLDAMHATAEIASGATMAPLPWRVQPADRTSSFLECWLPAGATPDEVSLTLHGPGSTYGAPAPIAATLSGPGTPGETVTTPVIWHGEIVGQLSLDQDRSGRWRYLVALAPTEGGIEGHAPAGLWKLSAQNTGDTARTLRFWIQRDISYGRGFTGARQSYFDEPANQRITREGRLSEVDSPGAMTARTGSLNGMATGSSSLVLGAAKGWGSGAEGYTSAAMPAETQQVDAAAMVSRTEAEVGRLSLTVRSGGQVRLTGTSVSAPAIGAALATVIAEQPAGPAPSNYADALAPVLDPVAPEMAPRLGSGVLD